MIFLARVKLTGASSDLKKYKFGLNYHLLCTKGQSQK